MTATKTRFEFLLDTELAVQINALAQSSGTTKTDLLVKAIKAFLERGIESEFAHLTAKRFDTFSHSLEVLRHDLKSMRQELEQVKNDAAVTRESLALFIQFSLMLNAKVPPPDLDTRTVGQKRFFRFVDQVARQIASGKSFLDVKNEEENP